MGTIFFCGDKALKAHTPGGVCAAHPGGLCVVGYTWLRPLASTAFSFSGFFSFFGSLFLGCQSSVHGTSPMCDRYSYELLFQLVPVGHSLLFFARSLDDPLLRMPSSILGVVSVFAPVEHPLTFLRLFVLCWGLDSTSLILGRFVLSAKSAFPPFFGDSHSMRRYLRPCSILSSFFLSLSLLFFPPLSVLCSRC